MRRFIGNRQLCPIRDCSEQISEPMLMCKRHWWQVPDGLRKLIWRLFKSDAGSAPHRKACFDAIDAVNDKAAPKAEQGSLGL